MDKAFHVNPDLTDRKDIISLIDSYTLATSQSLLVYFVFAHLSLDLISMNRDDDQQLSPTRYEHHSGRVDDTSCMASCYRTETDFNTLPATKKRKLGPTQSYSSSNVLQQQPSFTEVLEKLNEDAKGNTCASLWSLYANAVNLKMTQ